jgi:hypothetical protein
MSIFEVWNPNKRKVWKELERKYNGKYLNGNIFSSEKVQIDKDGLLILLDTRWEDGEYNKKNTRIIAPYENKTGFHCEIFKEGFFESMGKKLGMQDIEVGIEEFDKNFVLKSNQPNTLRNILAESKLIEEIGKHPNMKFMVETKNRFLGEFHPAGIDQLSFEEEGEITDIQKIESIFEIFSMFYNRMIQLGVAS